LLATSSARELAEEMAFSQIEPEPEIRNELMLAQVCLILASVHGDGKTKYSLQDFLLFEEPVEVSQENQMAMLMATPVSKPEGN